MARKKKKIKVRTPSGRNVVRMKKGKPSVAKCAKCGSQLHGIPKLRGSKMSRMPKSKKAPNRPYGGYLCVKCTREAMKKKV